jgi:hypothetical protein
MNAWLGLTDQQRRTTIEQAAANSGITNKAIEKDWWVTLCLKAIFQTPSAQWLIFKGGTSLSKGWKLIERFSEDVDLALDPVAFGMESRLKPSHDYLRKLKKNGCVYTSTIFKKELEVSMSQLGVPERMLSIIPEDIKPTIPDKDPQTIFVHYPSLYEKHSYFNDEVKIEVGVRSLKDPFEMVSIRSLLDEFFPNELYTKEPFAIPAAAPHKTFLEKIFLLHEKFASAAMERGIGDRQSRHLYDLFNLMEKDAGKTALQDEGLYREIIEHRRHHVHMKGIDYDHLFPSTVSFLPPDEWLEAFRKDYQTMQSEMIYGDPPSFDEMIDKLKILLGRIRLMGETRSWKK